MQEWDIVKQKLGQRAAELVKEHSFIGLGSGTTSECFIHALAETVKKGSRSPRCLATSLQSEKVARTLGLSVMPFHSWKNELLDVVVDGADCIDHKGNMIKGLGGALLREKLVALAAKRYIILVDERKRTTALQGKLPVEILPYGVHHIIERIQSSGYTGTLREKEDGRFFLTDNGNLLFDIDLPYESFHVEEVHFRLKELTGVVETGFFLRMRPEILTGYSDGRSIYEVT